MSKAPILTIEKFNEGEDSKYLITSPKEIQLTLRAIAQKGYDAFIYFDNEKHFFKTVLLAANEQGVWFDVGPNDKANNLALNSEELTFVTLHQGAKVQFSCAGLQVAIYASHPAFHCPLPDTMVRLQRRDFFRLPIPNDTPLKCNIPQNLANDAKVESTTIIDISVGGVALLCKGQNVRLEAGVIYPECRIELPDIGSIRVTIQVKNLFDVTSAGGTVVKHAGCEFVNLDGKTSMQLQRYISVMQSKLTGLH